MIAQREFNLTLACALHSASTDPKAGNLQVVFFEFIAEDQLNLVATDGHRITVIELAVPHGQPAGSSFILFAPYAARLVKNFPAKGCGRISISCWDDSIIFSDGTGVEVFQKLEGDPQFPDYRRVLTHPQTPPENAELNGRYALEALSALKPLGAGSVKIELGDRGPCYFTPRIDSKLKAVKSAMVGIMAIAPRK